MAAVGALKEEMSGKVERRLREIAYESTGIVLGPEKVNLLMSRVNKRLRALTLATYGEYLERLEREPNERQHFINAITTNTTSFWREADHFDIASKLLRGWVQGGQRRFRIWCSASSTGQEPYTIALSLLPIVEEHHLDLQILATDIDTNVLTIARKAIYSAESASQVPAHIRAQSFEALPDNMFRVVERARRLVRFGQLNLTKPPFPMKGPLDLIFCRNVMIYLDQPTRKRLVEEFERLLRPEGVLLIGHSESVIGLGRKLEVVEPSFYRIPARSP